jgi:glycosyltransferase involved in cell wall biosynthesis
MMDFSIVIPTLNLKPSLDVVLRCLEAQTYPHNKFECIVIDDGSTDESLGLVERDRPFSLKFISHRTTLGRAAARNSGWRESSGRVIVFLDADTLPHPDLLLDYWRQFERCEPDIASGERRCIDIDPAQDRLLCNLSALVGVTPDALFREGAQDHFNLLHGQSFLGPYKLPAFSQFEMELRTLCSKSADSPMWAYTCVGANIAIRRSALDAVNGFDPSLERGEDTDLGIRLWEIGAKFVFADGAKSYHQCAPREGSSMARNFPMKDSIMFFYRHPYRHFLLVHLWFLEQLARRGAPTTGGFRSLEALLDDSEFDIEKELRNRGYGWLPLDCRHSRRAIIEYYTDIFKIPSSLVTDAVDRALRDGIYVRGKGDSVRFDFFLLSNWLRYCAPFHEYLLRRVSYFWNHRSHLKGTTSVARRMVLDCHGVYEITIDASTLAAEQGIAAIANVPLPIENAVQSNVAIVRCDPPDLLEFANEQRTTIPRYCWQAPQHQVKVWYEFKCTVAEMDGGRSDLEQADLSMYLREDVSPKQRPKLENIMRKIMATGPQSRANLPRVIYRWILDNVRSYELPPGLSNVYESGVSSSCIEYARLFINLCRLARIPARECCGALFAIDPAIEGGQTIEANSLFASPFMHTWAEFYIPGKGWLPVDFCTWNYGKRAVTVRNVPDPSLQTEIAANTEMTDSYFFGSLDPFRIHTSVEANKCATSFALNAGTYPDSWSTKACVRHSLKVEAHWRNL